MFASPRHQPVVPAALAALAERIRPVSTNATQLLPVASPLTVLLPGGLRRGSIVEVRADGAGGATTLALWLMGAASKSGSWCGVVGLPSLGGLAAEQAGIDLAHLICIPQPGIAWAQVVARLIEGIDIIALRPPAHVPAQLARRVMARLRERRAVLLLLTDDRVWPEPCDLRLQVCTACWESIGPGEDCLRRRSATVVLDGRRAPACGRRVELWFPDHSTPGARA